MKFKSDVPSRIIVEIAIGVMLSILLAELLSLKNTSSAGITTILTIQMTRKETIKDSMIRLIAFILMISLTFIVFKAIGFTAYGYAIFLALYVIIGLYFNMRSGLSSNAVLASHILAEGVFSVEIVQNEFLIMLIGAGVGVLLNIIIPLKHIPLEYYHEKIERDLHNILKMISKRFIYDKGEEQDLKICAMNHDIKEEIKRLQYQLDQYYEKIVYVEDNYLNKDFKDRKKHLEMRRKQAEILQSLWYNVSDASFVGKQNDDIVRIMEKLQYDLYHPEELSRLKEDLDCIIELFHKEDSATTKEEFQYRANLLMIINNLDALIIEKMNYLKDKKEGNN
ncbi:MAG: aromatic acid exporter family protein [Tissierellia bacterium]|nr:aromatic acid exporter family protein [Tissierellia bacterium]